MSSSDPRNADASRRRTAALAAGVAAGERSAVARALNLLDDKRPSTRPLALALLSALPPPETMNDAHLVGFTGPPGAGKSTLICALVNTWRARNLTVGVAAVDPSSPLTGGALLGDRLRMQVPADDDGVFIRSLASRHAFGGVADELLPMLAVMLAAFDRVIIETVGVGQREVDVALIADTTCLVVQPGAGDSVQFLKAGIMEVPDILVVNKADLGTLADHARDELKASLGAGDKRAVLMTSATNGAGVSELSAVLDRRHAALKRVDGIAPNRRAAQVAWIERQLLSEFGTFGLALLGGRAGVADQLHSTRSSLLARLAGLRSQLLTHFAAAGELPLPAAITTFQSSQQNS